MHLAIEWSIKLTAKDELAGLLGLAGLVKLAGFVGLAWFVCQWFAGLDGLSGLVGFSFARLIGLAGLVGLAEFVRLVGHDGFVQEINTNGTTNVQRFMPP